MKIMQAKFPGKCAACGEAMEKGSEIAFAGRGIAYHHPKCTPDDSPGFEDDNGKETVVKALQTLHGKLANGGSEAFREYMNFLGKMYKYSWNNRILIWCQNPNATHVAGKVRWRKLGREVLPENETGPALAILAPRIVQRRDSNGRPVLTKTGEKETICIGFQTVFVYDVSQTTGDPIPEHNPLGALDGNVGDAFNKLLTVAEAEDIAVSQVGPEVLGGALGAAHHTSRRIDILATLDENRKVTTLAHELAHVLLGHTTKDNPYHKLPKNARELEAEAVAYCVGTALGLKMDDVSADYILMWKGNADVFVGSMERIGKVAEKLVKALR